MEDIVIVETKDFAQVIFENVDECYIENQPLECNFTLNPLLKVDSSDFIGIYKVGFSSCKEYILSMPVNADEFKEDSCKAKLVFDSEKLPKDDGEFYQFVYVSQSKLIRGASLPFQFKRTHLTDYVQIDDNEAVIINSKEYEIKETIKEIKAKCDNLAQENETYEKLLKENEALIAIFKEEISDFKSRCLKLSTENEKLNFTLKNRADNLKNYSETLSNLNEENGQLKGKFEEISLENRNLIESLQRRINQVESLKHELDALKIAKGDIETNMNVNETELALVKKEKDDLCRLNTEISHVNANLKEQIMKLEKLINERNDELTKVKTDLKHSEAAFIEQTQTIKNLLIERDSLNSLIEKMNKEKADLESSKELIAQELIMSKDKLMAAEQCKEMLKSQLNATSNELEEANIKTKDANKEIMALMDKNDSLENEAKELKEAMKKLKSDYDMKLEQANGSYYALHLAHGHLESRMKVLQQKHEQETQEHKLNIDNLAKENDNLRDRLTNGAQEYTNLNKKYLRLKNLIFNSKLKNELKNLKMESSCMTDSVFNDKNDTDQVMSTCTSSDKTLTKQGSLATADLNVSAEFEPTLVDDYMNSSFYSTMNQAPNNMKQSATAPITPLISPANRTTENEAAKRDLKLKSVISDTLLLTTVTHLDEKSYYNNNTAFNLPMTPLTGPQSTPVTFTTFKPNNLQNAMGDLTHKTQNLAVSSSFANNNNKMTSSGLCLIDFHDEKSDTPMPRKETRMRSCEICGLSFPEDVDAYSYEQHLTTHYGPTCPVCFFRFHKGYPLTDFENHVNSHFSN